MADGTTTCEATAEDAPEAYSPDPETKSVWRGLCEGDTSKAAKEMRLLLLPVQRRPTSIPSQTHGLPRQRWPRETPEDRQRARSCGVGRSAKKEGRI